jgi:hypothetical protein
MHRIAAVALMFVIAGCASTKSVAPREYLDEQTAATITVVADPWIFTRKNAPPQLDFFNLYAIDVNRMGDHKKYFVVVHYWPEGDMATTVPTLVLNAGSQELRIQPTADDSRKLGIAQPLDKAAPSSSKSWFYPVDKTTLQSLAQTRQLAAALVTAKTNAEYVVWRDGSSELSEFAVAVDR